MLVGGEDDDLSGGSESIQAVLDYVDAAEEGDCEAVIDLVTEESVQMIGDGGRSDAIAGCEDAPSAALERRLELGSVTGPLDSR